MGGAGLVAGTERAVAGVVGGVGGVVDGVVDRLLDRTVVPGYSRIGYAVRRLGRDPLPDGALLGRRVLVTGATGGLGLAIAAGCARLGADVHVLGRDRGRGEEALRRLRPEVRGGSLTLELCDVGSLADVRRFCADLTERVPSLDGLVHNAGTMAPERTETAEGHELTFALHVLGPHLMTRLLADRLADADDSRVVFMSSGGMYAQRLDVEDPELRHGRYTPTAAYARTKRMQVVLAEEWAQRLAPRGISVHGMHPGWADTGGVQQHLPVFRFVTRPILRTAEEGADTAVWLLATDDLDPATGGFWQDRHPRPTHLLGRTRESPADRAAFWAFCEAATA
jgi:NAD(P)-dependent dehydrogenase (short-subunit alcohol dehydrogenase family)